MSIFWIIVTIFVVIGLVRLPAAIKKLQQAGAEYDASLARETQIRRDYLAGRITRDEANVRLAEEMGFVVIGKPKPRRADDPNRLPD